MKRRFYIRRQKALLIAAIRFGYGGTIAILWASHLAMPDSVLAQLMAVNSLGSLIVVFSLLFSSLLLLADSLLDFLWPLLVSPSLERICRKKNIFWVVLRKTQSTLASACAMANRWRHWFYLPPAVAALFVIPAAVWHGIEGYHLLKWLYFWLSVCGVGCALIEAAINNERGKYENRL